MQILKVFQALGIICAVVAGCQNNDIVQPDCPPCPNNTECIDEDCGCPPDKHDMGSWCLPKSDNLFVAATLDGHCLGVVGLYLLQVDTLNGLPGSGTNIATSSYRLISNETSFQGSSFSTFDYLRRPDGDSIIIWWATLPDFSSNCWISNNLNCQLDMFGKFRGPDTIQMNAIWRRCRDAQGNASAFRDTIPMTFIRWK